MLRRYRTLNNETEINVDGARLRAGDDGVFVVEAGSRAEDVLIAGGAISAHLFSLLFDDAGNLIANVNHRTGNLASLLQLDGGDGEISVATDVEAFVKHTGVAGGARAHYTTRNKIAELILPFSASADAATPTKVDLITNGLTSSFLGFSYDDVNQKFMAPLGTAMITAQMAIATGHDVVAAKTMQFEVKSTDAASAGLCTGELYVPVTGKGGSIICGNANLGVPAATMFDTEFVSLWFTHDDAAARQVFGTLYLQFWDARQA